jgi:hypothetical protein
LTGEPTLVNLHTAVGLGNAMGAIINAARGHSPLVITAGQQVRATLTMEPLLANPDPTTLPRPAVKWAFEPPRPAGRARGAQLRAATSPGGLDGALGHQANGCSRLEGGDVLNGVLVEAQHDPDKVERIV